MDDASPARRRRSASVLVAACLLACVAGGARLVTADVASVARGVVVHTGEASPRDLLFRPEDAAVTRLRNLLLTPEDARAAREQPVASR